MLSSSKWKQSYSNGKFTEGQIYSVLKNCDIKIGGEIDTHFLLFCPFHYNVNTPACEIDKTSGMYICFSCGESGSITDMVMKTTNRTYFESMRLINSHSSNIDIEKQIDEIVNKNSDIKPFDMDLIKQLHSNLTGSSRAKNYLYGRNINDNSQHEMMIGYSVKQDMITVPIFNVDATCVGFVGRSIDGKIFKNSTGLPKKQILFNLDKSKRKDLVVVESSFDAIRLWQIGIPAVATLGATISKDQIRLLSTYSNSITVCPDNDDAGKRLEVKIKDNIKNKVVNVIRLTNGKDVGDHSDEELLKIFKDVGNSFVLTV